MNRIKKAALGVVLAGAGLTAGIGLLHTSVGRPLLAAIGGCPIKATPAAAEAARMNSVAKMRGDSPASAKPAAGFTMDRSSPDDVRAWAKKHGLACKDAREGMLITCTDVPVSALGDRPAQAGAVSEVAFAFRPRDKALVNLSVTTNGLPAKTAASEMTRTKARLDEQLGTPTTAAGDITESYFSKGALSTAMVSYNRSDFVAEISATAFGARGVMLREHYVSAVD